MACPNLTASTISSGTLANQAVGEDFSFPFLANQAVTVKIFTLEYNPFTEKGSEHKIDGAHSDMEMQMVFFDRRCNFSFLMQVVKTCVNFVSPFVFAKEQRVWKGFA